MSLYRLDGAILRAARALNAFAGIRVIAFASRAATTYCAGARRQRGVSVGWGWRRRRSAPIGRPSVAAAPHAWPTVNLKSRADGFTKADRNSAIDGNQLYRRIPGAIAFAGR